jgi:hypothetical protein
MNRIISAKLSLAAITASLAVPASAEMKYENGSGGSAHFYGQLDPAYLSFDDGVSNTSELVDNSGSNSRVGFWLRQSYGENEFTFNFETALGFRPSIGLSQTNIPKGVDWQAAT